MQQVWIRMVSGQAQQFCQDKLQDINWDNVPVCGKGLWTRCSGDATTVPEGNNDATRTISQRVRLAAILYQPSVRLFGRRRENHVSQANVQRGALQEHPWHDKI